MSCFRSLNIFFLLFLLTVQVFTQTRMKYMPNEFLIRTHEPISGVNKVNGFIKTNESWFNTLSDDYKINDLEPIYQSSASLHEGRYIVRYSNEMSISQIIERLKNDQKIVWVQPNYIYYSCNTPIDTRFGEQWSLNGSPMDLIKARDAWDITSGNSEIVIAVIDLGPATTHEDLVNQLWENPIEANGITGEDDDGNGVIDDINCYDVLYDEGFYTPTNHGTAVAGICCAQTNNNNGIGIAGVSGGGFHGDLGTRLMAINGGFMSFISSDIAKAIRYAYDPHNDESTDDGADVINMSFSGPSTGFESWSGQEFLIEEAVEEAYTYGREGKGVVFVAASGNKGADVDTEYPGSYQEVIAVGGVDSYGVHWSGTSTYEKEGSGMAPDIWAPGDGNSTILSTKIDGGYYGGIGKTSAASPHVAGVAGLILSINADLYASEVKDILMNTKNGNGIVNAYEALKYTLENYGGTLRGDVTLHESLVLEPGVTLNIAEGTTININGYYNIIVKDGARIVANGTEQNPITFTAAPGVTRWKNIFVYGSNSEFRHCIFEKGYWALKIEPYPVPSSSGNIVQNCEFKNNDIGLRIHKNDILVQDCDIHHNRMGAVCFLNDFSLFKSNHIHDNTGEGVYSSGNTKFHLRCNVIEDNNSYGFTSYNGDNVYFGISDPGNREGYNTIRNNSSHEINSNYGVSTVLLGMAMGWLYAGTQNAIYDNDNYEIYNATGNPTILAQYCWWESDGPYKTNNVMTDPTLPYGPSWVGSTTDPIGKALPAVNQISNGQTSESIVDLINDLKNTVENDPNSTKAQEALLLLSAIIANDFTTDELSQKPGYYSYLENLYQSYKQILLGEIALDRMVHWKIAEGDYDKALKLTSEAKQLMKEERKADAYLNETLLYILMHDAKKARKSLEKCQTKFSYDSRQIKFVEEELVCLEEMIEEGIIEAKDVNKPAEESFDIKQEDSQPESPGLSQNYPNPFNPVTAIPFTLTAAGNVTIKIYDVQGKEVVTLLDGMKSAGSHQIEWDGKDGFGNKVSSGIYFYTLKTHDRFERRKMTLMK